MPLDSFRKLPIPDASHQLKSTLLSYKGSSINVIVATVQECKNLKKIADFKSYSYLCEDQEDYFSIILELKKIQG